MKNIAKWLLGLGLVLLVGSFFIRELTVVVRIPEMIGWRDEKTYLVLLQNHTELRPTGGFMGSYGLITLNKGKIKKIEIQDIYEPDGRVVDHILPPGPIQEAFQLGTWRLRDTNWPASFPEAAKTILWFFDKAGISEIDGVLATNLMVFEDLIDLVGPLELVDYDEVITGVNLWEITQTYSQENFFPGSKQKKEFISDLSAELKEKIFRASIYKKFQVIKLAIKMLSEKQIMLYSQNTNTQKILQEINWAGKIKSASCPWWSKNCVSESLMIVEANLGVNKANCCIERKVKMAIISDDGGLRHILTLNYKNNSSKDRWGGTYRAWVRVLAPNPEQEHGFWIEVPEGEAKEYQAEYFLPVEMSQLDKPISLLIQKQSGIEEVALELIFSSEKRKQNSSYILRSDKKLILK